MSLNILVISTLHILSYTRQKIVKQSGISYSRLSEKGVVSENFKVSLYAVTKEGILLRLELSRNYQIARDHKAVSMSIRNTVYIIFI